MVRRINERKRIKKIRGKRRREERAWESHGIKQNKSLNGTGTSQQKSKSLKYD